MVSFLAVVCPKLALHPYSRYGGALLAHGAVLASDPVYDASGFQPGRDYASAFPFEHVDTVTGNVLLTFTDLVLPGNAGFNLNISRTYNSRDGKWRFGIDGVPLRFTQTGSDLSDVDFITPDGSTHNASGAGSQTITREFWQFTKATRRLELPNGIVATYGHDVAGAGFLTEIRDPFDNVVTLAWESGQPHLLSLTQDLAGHSRTLTFTSWWTDTVSWIDYGARRWRYEWQSVNASPQPLIVLTEFAPPTGPSWTFGYTIDAQNGSKVQSVGFPGGAVMTYGWGVETFPSTPADRVVIESRHTSGNVPAADWTFAWEPNSNRLVITGPANKVSYDANDVDGQPRAATRTLAALDGTVLRTESATYTTIPGALGPTPAVQTHTIVQDGRTFTTTLSYSSDNYADFGQPNQIQEVGELSRTTTIAYKHDFAKYIRGRAVSTTVTVSGASVGGHTSTSTSRTFDDTTGFLTSSTSSGLTTHLAEDGHGNVGSVTDPTGHTTTFSYEWGVLKDSTAPLTATTRVINDDGTVASESDGVLVTAHSYDANGRLISTSTNVPGRVGVSASYAATSTTVTRGAQTLTSELDGYGRVVHTIDSVGTEARTTYNAAGQVTYSSYSFDATTPEVGVTYTYDGLGRQTGMLRPDGSNVSIEYIGADVRRIDSVTGATSHVTRQTFQAFGSPSSAWLTSLLDPQNATWWYSYDVFGHLVRVDSTVGPVRTWTYDADGFLTQSTEPESGTTTFVDDGVGRLASREDARGAVSHVAYGYDANGRVVSVDAPGTADDVSTSYDSRNLPITVTNNAVQSTFAYDIAGRLTSQTDVIGGHSFVQTFEYDGMDNLVAQVYPVTGRRLMYDYDSQGRLAAVRMHLGSAPDVTLASNFQYSAHGSSFQYGNGQVRSITLDSRKRPQHLVDGPFDQTYAYDHVGNVTATTDPRPGFNSTYSYDALDRLTGVSGFDATSYTYDGSGNRLSQGNIAFNYNAQWRLDHLSGGDSGNFTYEANGSLASDPSGATYTYTALNMAKTSTLNGVTTSYFYGGDGTRHIKRGADGIDHYFITGGSGLLAEYVGSGAAVALVREYVNLGGQLLASITPEEVTLPPIAVSITSPSSGATIGYWQSMTLTATVNVPAGTTVSRVEYYNDGNLVGQATGGSYAVSLTAVFMQYGAHTLLARVVTTDNHAVASTPVTFIVQP